MKYSPNKLNVFTCNSGQEHSLLPFLCAGSAFCPSLAFLFTYKPQAPFQNGWNQAELSLKQISSNSQPITLFLPSQNAIQFPAEDLWPQMLCLFSLTISFFWEISLFSLALEISFCTVTHFHDICLVLSFVMPVFIAFIFCLSFALCFAFYSGTTLWVSSSVANPLPPNPSFFSLLFFNFLAIYLPTLLLSILRWMLHSPSHPYAFHPLPLLSGFLYAFLCILNGWFFFIRNLRFFSLCTNPESNLWLTEVSRIISPSSLTCVYSPFSPLMCLIFTSPAALFSISPLLSISHPPPRPPCMAVWSVSWWSADTV